MRIKFKRRPRGVVALTIVLAMLLTLVTACNIDYSALSEGLNDLGNAMDMSYNQTPATPDSEETISSVTDTSETKETEETTSESSSETTSETSESSSETSETDPSETSETSESTSNGSVGGLSLSSYDRAKLERLVMGEAGSTGYYGASLVAQCIRDAMVRSNTTSIDEIISDYGYYGSTATEPNSAVKEAVSFIFDQGGSAVNHRIIVFYIGQSAWHETQNFVTEYCGMRFFDLNE